ncbi:MAG: fumarylacetoacetate hydrolase family protein [Hyphomicrobiales bacterium]|nr:fumarylacetoacetate hydrolase family protein [Hyphomicrobiales bacterium]
MRFVAYSDGGTNGLATAREDGSYVGRLAGDPRYPGELDALVAKGQGALRAAHEALLGGGPVDLSKISFRAPLARPGKIICVGLNYADHSAESGFKQPDYPTLFSRFASGFVAQGEPMVRPKVSDQFDYEGELVAVVGKGGRHIAKGSALDHIIGYSIFNDGSIRDYQFKSPQWTVGKNFDGTGAFGPVFVTADELPPGCLGLKLETRLNGVTVQSAKIDDMVFDIPSLVSTISEAMTLEAGDIIVTGTPSGVGMARKPPLYMKAGDVIEVEVEKIGVLRNPVIDEA